MTRTSRPCVSVVVPCYNHAAYLKITVDSIRSQTFADWECIIVDDGSTDDSRAVALDLAATDSRVRYVYQENKGPAGALNRGIDEARGQYIELIGADDVMEPEKLALQVEMLSATDELRLAYCDFYWCDLSGRSIDVTWNHRVRLDESSPLHDIALNWGTEISIHPACFLIDARVFKEYGVRHNETIRANEDYDLWIKVFALKPKVFYLDRKLVGYRIVAGSVSHNTARLRSTFFDILREQRKAFAGDREMLALLRKKAKYVKREFIQHAPPYEPGWWIWRCRGLARRIVPANIYLTMKRVMRRG